MTGCDRCVTVSDGSRYYCSEHRAWPEPETSPGYCPPGLTGPGDLYTPIYSVPGSVPITFRYALDTGRRVSAVVRYPGDGNRLARRTQAAQRRRVT